MKALEYKPKSTLKPLYLFPGSIDEVFIMGLFAGDFAKAEQIYPNATILSAPSQLWRTPRPRVIRMPGWNKGKSNHVLDQLERALMYHQAIVEDVKI